MRLVATVSAGSILSCERTLVNVLSCMESLYARKREAHVAHGQELSTCGFVKVLPDPDCP